MKLHGILCLSLVLVCGACAGGDGVVGDLTESVDLLTDVDEEGDGGLTNTSTQTGVRSDHGQVKISWE
ncbi:MAG: hypothetical protein ABIK09_12180 [Pseudomonadota bacterium]